ACDAAGACRSALGQKCAHAADCASGHCADGVCCNSDCPGQCESCALAGQMGTCAAANGAAPPGRPPCPAAAPDNACSGHVCDGSNRDTCAGLAGFSVSCGAASCTAGMATSARSCDGKGQCQGAGISSCTPYVCAGTTCATSCRSDSDCHAQFT